MIQMTDSDRYNGWTNRETWALQIWLGNDQGLYEMVRDRVSECAHAIARDNSTDDDSTITPADAGETVKALWEMLTDPDEGLMTAENILKMVRDVGSDYRVNWDEIGRHWVANLDEDDS